MQPEFEADGLREMRGGEIRSGVSNTLLFMLSTDVSRSRRRGFGVLYWAVSDALAFLTGVVGVGSGWYPRGGQGAVVPPGAWL